MSICRRIRDWLSAWVAWRMRMLELSEEQTRSLREFQERLAHGPNTPPEPPITVTRGPAVFTHRYRQHEEDMDRAAL